MEDDKITEYNKIFLSLSLDISHSHLRLFLIKQIWAKVWTSTWPEHGGYKGVTYREKKKTCPRRDLNPGPVLAIVVTIANCCATGPSLWLIRVGSERLLWQVSGLLLLKRVYWEGLPPTLVYVSQTYPGFDCVKKKTKPISEKKNNSGKLLSLCFKNMPKENKFGEVHTPAKLMLDFFKEPKNSGCGS